MKSPKIRFKEFQNDWNSRILGDFNIEMLKGSGISKNDLNNNGKNPCIHYGELFTYYKEFITEIKSKTNNGSVFSKINDVLMPTSDVTPNGLAKASCIKFDNVALSGDILILRCKDKIDGVFLAYIIRSNKKKILELVSGTTVYHIYAKDMKNFNLYYPNDIKEQEKIGEFFRKIDGILDLENSRFKKLENFKKTMLDKLFVKDGADEPQIRLGSFKGEWTSRILGDICEIIPINSYLTTPKNNGKYPVIQQGFEPIAGYSSQKNYFKNFDNVLLFGDHTLSLYKPKTPFFIASDGIKILKLKNKNSYFFKNLFLYKMPKSEGYKRHFSILKEIETRIPNDIKEQEAIGEFFRKIDGILEFSQKKITKLENIKKYLLNKMFV
ncbi:restriction endonuclease subunit S [Campylobacter sp.]|uniref:restriction endonuclease subunit S n=1 Tax=Campylobacter sp. TaxID=205 RepID=UPI002A83EECE|nr:restriction endonuclease subunit S [Campylobacter sp.]MDY4802712.1 restriction endonuclease subunit S [Campylobacter sp.]